MAAIGAVARLRRWVEVAAEHLTVEQIDQTAWRIPLQLNVLEWDRGGGKWLRMVGGGAVGGQSPARPGAVISSRRRSAIEGTKRGPVA